MNGFIETKSIESLLTNEQYRLFKRLEQSRKNGTGLQLSDPASVGILHQTILDLAEKVLEK